MVEVAMLARPTHRAQPALLPRELALLTEHGMAVPAVPPLTIVVDDQQRTGRVAGRLGRRALTAQGVECVAIDRGHADHPWVFRGSRAIAHARAARPRLGSRPPRRAGRS